jgi:thiamine biosynthesis lipoprotein
VQRLEHIMGMPVIVNVVGDIIGEATEATFAFFRAVDERYSTYKPTSEISRINAGLPRHQWSREMTAILELCEQTKHQTGGYFDINTGSGLDPSGLVKGWAINEAARRLHDQGYHDFYLEAGGDIQVAGHDEAGRSWRIGVRHPFDRQQIVKVIVPGDRGVATSGSYIRGQHVYNPHDRGQPLDDIVSLTVVGPNVYEADRYATAAFAMGRAGIGLIDGLDGFEGYMIDRDQLATITTGFEALTA